MTRSSLFLTAALLALAPAAADDDAAVVPPPVSAVNVAAGPLVEDLFTPFEAGEDAVRLEAVYRGYFGPFKLGTLTLKATFDGDRYEVTSDLKTEGLVDVFASNDLRTQTLGRLEDGARVPEIYRSQLFKKDDKSQLVELIYEADGASLWSEPAYDLERFPVTADDIRGSADPLSSLILIGLDGGADAPPCEGVARVFDGKRRYNLNLSDAGVTTFRGRNGKDYDGEAYRCRALYEKVAGFKTIEASDDEEAANLWLADIPEFNLRAPVRISYGTDYGDIVMRAKRLVVETPEMKVMLAGKCNDTVDVCRSD